MVSKPRLAVAGFSLYLKFLIKNNSDMSKKCLKKEPCTESKLLALHTSIVCLAKTLAEAGVLDRADWKNELMKGREWLSVNDDSQGHSVQSFDQLLEMLNSI